MWMLDGTLGVRPPERARPVPWPPATSRWEATVPSVVKHALEDICFPEFLDLLREAHAEIVGGTGMEGVISEPHYRWKYASPFGAAVAALVVHGNKYIASTSMFPLEVVSSAGVVRAWQCCDAATRADARGQGWFTRCLTSLRTEIGENEIFFAFPNKNSAPGFRKFGWQHHGDVHTRIRLLPSAQVHPSPGMLRLTRFGDAQDRLVTQLVSGSPMLNKTAAYMNWRYFDHPLNRAQYECFTGHEEGFGTLVMRDLSVLGQRFAVIMELLGRNPGEELQMLRFATRWAARRGIQRVLAMDNTLANSIALRAGYCLVPQRLLPKRQMLMGADYGGGVARRIWAAPWRVAIGDWDAF